MAIPFGHIDIVGTDGIVTLSAYICRERRVDDISGFVANFRHRLSDLIHTEVSVPEGTPLRFGDGAALWNAALERERTTDRKTRERRFKKGAQVAKHLVLALPRELSNAQQIELVRAFVQAEFVRHGVAAEWAIHIDAEGSNPHAHILVTTRELTGEGFGLKVRKLNPGFATNKKNRVRFVSEQDGVSDRWAQAQNNFFLNNGLDLTVDPKRVVNDVHRGLSWHIQDAELEAQSRAAHEQAIEAMNSPSRVLDGVTARLSTFTRRDLEKFVKKHGVHGEDCTKAVDSALAHATVLQIWDPAHPESSARFTTTVVRDQEAEIVRLADKLQRCGANLSPDLVGEAASRFTLDPEQRDALMYACQVGLILLVGRAGTGKSRTLAAIASAKSAGGYRVVGLAPTNAAAISLRAEGIEFSSTIHRALWEIQNGKQSWDKNTVLIIDEAGLADSETLYLVMKEAAKTGSQVILGGDDRQFLSVARGGMFGFLSSRMEARTIAAVRRQHADWQRQASRLLADGDIRSAVRMYSERGHVHWATNCDESIGRLIEAWGRDESSGNNVRFIYASTNKAVDRLNAEAQRLRLAKGELSNPATFVAAKGRPYFALVTEFSFIKTIARSASPTACSARSIPFAAHASSW